MLGVAGRTALIYVLMLVMIRVLGKRTIGNLTAFDMLIVLMMGDLAGDAIYGDASLGMAVVAVVTLSALHYANSWLAYGLPRIGRFLEGMPTTIVREGGVEPAGLRRERMNEHEVLAELRLAGIDDLRDVKHARVESDGRVSVIREEWAEPLKRSDVRPVEVSTTEEA
jgi:uncharacterized membrane protein YcaP (DUF421 family)